MAKPKRIDRNNYSPERVLEIVKEGPRNQNEVLRLLEESAHAYMMLRADARELASAVEDTAEYAAELSKRIS